VDFNYTEESKNNVPKITNYTQQSYQQDQQFVQTYKTYVPVEWSNYITEMKDMFINMIDSLGILANQALTNIQSYYNGLTGEIKDFFNDFWNEANSWLLEKYGENFFTIFQSTKTIINLAEELFDPLVIYLGKDWINLISYETSNAFVDLNNDGFRDHVGWVGTGANGVVNDGFVFEDKNNNGIADGIAELVGGDDGTGNVRGAFLTLKEDYDTNHDYNFDNRDAKFNSMKLWIDANQNGVSEASANDNNVRNMFVAA
jgi:hypothetical protein